MYTLFVQKRKSVASPFPLTQQLHDFLIHTKANGIFISPGHLTTSATNVELLLHGLLNGTQIKKFGIGNRYGGNYIHIYEEYLDRKGILWDVARNGNSDHRKMVFIFRYNEAKVLPALCYDNLHSVMDEIEVLGVALGSSNFSYVTYGSMFPGVDFANKGEADIFMFHDESYKDMIMRSIEEQYRGESLSMVLSQNLSPVPGHFLEDMFMQTLISTLEPV